MFGKEHMENVPLAVARIGAAGIDATERAYGFSVEHPERWHGPFLSCGCEHDASVSAAIYDGTVPLRRYYRFDFLELADFIIEAYLNSVEPKSRNALRESFDFIDSSYDHESLRLALNRELEIRGIPPAYDC